MIQRISPDGLKVEVFNHGDPRYDQIVRIIICEKASISADLQGAHANQHLYQSNTIVLATLQDAMYGFAALGFDDQKKETLILDIMYHGTVNRVLLARVFELGRERRHDVIGLYATIQSIPDWLRKKFKFVRPGKCRSMFPRTVVNTVKHFHFNDIEEALSNETMVDLLMKLKSAKLIEKKYGQEGFFECVRMSLFIDKASGDSPPPSPRQ